MADYYYTDRRSRNISRLIVAIALAVIVALLIWAVAVASRDKNVGTPEKQMLIESVKAGYPEGANNVTEAFLLWGFPEFSKNMVFNVEACYHNSYYKELPENEALASDAAEYFIENYYDNINLSDKAEVTHALCNSFIYAVGDKYGIYRNAEEQRDYSSELAGEIIGIGVTVTRNTDGLILITSVIADTPAQRAGILTSDIITAVDGARVADVGYRAASEMITGDEGTTVSLTVLRNGEELNIDIVRAKINDVTVSYKMLEGNIGYISISGFVSPTALQFVNAMDALAEAGAAGIIFDLRSNPGGLLSSVITTISCIVPTGTRLVSFSNGSSPVYATHGGTSPEDIDRVYTLPTVILINRSTASAGELFTAAMRDFADDGRFELTIIGETSYGKGVMQSGISFTDGSALTLTTALYYSPSGINYDGVGISPDIALAEDDDPIVSALAEMANLLN